MEQVRNFVHYTKEKIVESWQAFLDDLLHRQLTPEQRIERIMKVTKEDISRVALQMNLASVAIVAENENEL